MPSRFLALVAGLLLLAGCAREFLNVPLTEHKSNREVLAPPAAVAGEDPYIVISFSGGGVRASALGYAVLKELEAIPDRDGRPLTQHVRIVSSASGGSVTAAWFGLAGPNRLDELRDRFLTQDNMTPLALEAVNPVTWARLAGPSYSRIDVLREYFDRHLFEGKTFADLYARPGAPIVLLNATDMSAGEVFSFDGKSFDDLCSDLSRFPIAGAVAASAAFPVALTPLSLKNWRDGECKVDRQPTWVRLALGGQVTRHGNLPVYKRALATEKLRSGKVEYVHLLDGGLVDNLGSSSILRALFDPANPSRQLFNVNTGAIKSLVAIEVNARSETPNPIDVTPDTPGVFKVLGAVISNPIDSATQGHAENFASAVHELRTAGTLRNLSPAKVALPERIYPIVVDFDQFDSRDPQQVALRDRVKQVPTSWTMSATDLQDISAAAKQLLAQHPCFVRLREDLRGDPPSALGNTCPAEATPP